MPPMSAKLIVGILNIRSSYVQNSDQPAENGAHDTVQWWLEPGQAWRIRTFAEDHDIHVDWVGDGEPSDLIHYIEDNYDGLLERLEVVDIPNMHDEAQAAKILRRAGLEPNLEVAPDGFAYWNPDGGVYQTL
jgi:hypothetical protein